MTTEEPPAILELLEGRIWNTMYGSGLNVNSREEDIGIVRPKTECKTDGCVVTADSGMKC